MPRLFSKPLTDPRITGAQRDAWVQRVRWKGFLVRGMGSVTRRAVGGVVASVHGFATQNARLAWMSGVDDGLAHHGTDPHVIRFICVWDDRPLPDIGAPRGIEEAVRLLDARAWTNGDQSLIGLDE